MASGSGSRCCCCRRHAARRSTGRRAVLIAGVPHIRQEPDFCGEACVAMYLRKLGYDVDQRAVFDRAGLDPRLGRGVNTPELKRAVEAFGFRPGPVWYKVAAANAAAELQRQLEAHVRRPRARRPVDRLHALRSQPELARALPPGPRLRPRDERDHLSRARPGRRRLQAHAGRALPRAVAAQVRARQPGSRSASCWSPGRSTSAAPRSVRA